MDPRLRGDDSEEASFDGNEEAPLDGNEEIPLDGSKDDTRKEVREY